VRTTVNVEYVGDDLNEVVTRRGASGATIIVSEDCVTKLDVERTGTFVRKQGEWLSRWSPHVEMLPRVQRVLHNGYVMETLWVPQLHEINLDRTIELILHHLHDQLWSKTSGSFRFFDACEHRDYVYHLIGDIQPHSGQRKELKQKLADARTHIDFATLRVGLTHGDCIIDNVAYRGDELVIIDPIPASYGLPNLQAVDVGRLIQSAIGYEYVRYTRSSPITDYDDAVARVLNLWLPEFDINEARAAIYFAIIHTLRGVRTTTPGTTQRLGLWYLASKLQEVLRKWM